MKTEEELIWEAYDISQIEKEYDLAIRDKNIEKLKQLVRKQASSKGYTDIVYHWSLIPITEISNDSSFRVNLVKYFMDYLPFDDQEKKEILKYSYISGTAQIGHGLYCSRDKESWQNYSKDILSRIINIQKLPKELSKKLDDKYDIVKGGGYYTVEQFIESLISSFKRDLKGSNKINPILHELVFNPKDLVVAKSYSEASDYIGNGDLENIVENEILVKNTGNLKSFEPATFNNFGHMIPLSMRFDQSINDIRY